MWMSSIPASVILAAVSDLKAQHRSNPMFDASIILLNDVVHVFAGADGDELTSLLQSACRIALGDCHTIGLTAVNCNALWSAMAGQSLAHETFGSS